MKLLYYTYNKNFGDTLNPLIFNKLIPDFFDEDGSNVFLGIGSIIHFRHPDAKKTIVFSSGFAYGAVPIIDKDYDVLCVRGPLTARKLKLDSGLAITDGAALLRAFEWPAEPKRFEFSFMPHHESAHFFNWRSICERVGYNYIDPLAPHDVVIRQIRQSKVMIAEAMHGAIVADTFRVPWIPVKLYPTISEFKWEDWASSLNMVYEPNRLAPVYNLQTIQQRVERKLGRYSHPVLVKPTSGVYKVYQDIMLSAPTIKNFEQLRNARALLSDTKVLDSKVGQLQDKIEVFKRKYYQYGN